MKTRNLTAVIFLLVILFAGCDGNETVREWDVDMECGGRVDTDAFGGTANYLVWVKNSAESNCNVSVKSSGGDITPAPGTGRVYLPGTNKVYTRVFVSGGNNKLQIFCSGSEDDSHRCKFDYGVSKL